MSYDVNKIIEESVKDIIDSDGEDVLQEGVEGELEPQGSATEEGEEAIVTDEMFQESRDYFKNYFEEAADGKK
jgi:hypothetical protein